MIHVSDLEEAPENYRVRSLDLTHKDRIKASLRHMDAQNTILCLNVLGCTRQEAEEKVGIKGALRYQVIGGNHTRAAIQDLHLEGDSRFETWMADVYWNLSPEEALRGGFNHNSVAGSNKAMTFAEEVGLFRKVMALQPRTGNRIKDALWKRDLCHVIGGKFIKPDREPDVSVFFLF